MPCKPLSATCALVLITVVTCMPVHASRMQESRHPRDTARAAEPVSAVAASSLEDAVAAVVVVALTEQFDQQGVSVNIASYQIHVGSAGQRVVTGRGHVSLSGAAEPVPFDYRTVYDIASSSAGYPTISIGQIGSDEHSVPNDARLIGELDARVASALSQELAGRRVWLQLDTIRSYESSNERYVRVDARGVADFGPGGTADTQVQGLYDRTGKTWLRVHYELADLPSSGIVATGG